jgi:RNase P/RNase MRP subunit p29
MRLAWILGLCLTAFTWVQAPTTAHADVVHLASGGKVRGKIVKKTRREIVIKTRGGTTVVPRDEVDRIELGKTIEELYAARLKKITKTDSEARYSLGVWLKSQGERLLSRREFEKAIELDPNHRFARKALGYSLENGAWVKQVALPASSPTSGKRRSSAKKRKRVARFETPASQPLLAALEAARKSKKANLRLAGFETLANKTAEVDRILKLLEGEGQAKLRSAVIKHAPAAAASAGESLRPHVEGYVSQVLWPALDASLGAHTRRVARAHKRGVKRASNLFKEYRLGTEPGEKRTESLEKWISTRDAALKVIFDKSIYPDENHGRVGQPTVDEYVERVRAAWAKFDHQIQKDLAKLLSTSEDEARQLLSRIQAPATRFAEAAKQVQARGVAVEPLKASPAALRCLILYRAGSVGEALALSDGLNAWEKELLRRLRDERVREYNLGFKQKNPCTYGTKPMGEEVEQVRITNDYRILMGRQALEIDPRLIKSARGHSADMTRLGFFAHESRVANKRTPSARMSLAGYPGGGGENISLGSTSPKATHIAWYNSSGHHRNILTRTYWAMGSGKDGQHWTQNFGMAGTLKR